MDHSSLKEKLSAFRDQELPEEERRKIVSHLSSCEECREILNHWEIMGKSLAGAFPTKPSEGFIFKVMNRLDEMEESKKSAANRSPFQWLLPVMGYGAAFVLMFAVLSQGESPINTASVLMEDISPSARWTLSSEQPDINQLIGIS